LDKEETVLVGLPAAAAAAADITAAAVAGITTAAVVDPLTLGVSMEEQQLLVYKTVTDKLLFLGMHRVAHLP
jgi:hypothetical protein